MSTIGRAPKDYNAGAWGRIVGRIDKAINTLSKRLGAGEDATRQLQATQREQRSALTSMLTPEATFEWSEYVDPSTERVYGQCIIEVTRGWAIISDFEYREGDGNINSLTAWTSYQSGSNMSFVLNSNYKGGGYYLYRKELPFIKGDDRVSLVSVELRGKGADGDVWLQSSHTFDGNKVPQFRSEPKLVLQWDTATSEWNVIAIGEADDDTQSVAFYVSDNTQLSGIDGFSPSNFSTAVTNLSVSDKTFNVSLGYFPPSTKDAGPYQLPRTLYVAAGAFDDIDATPSNPDAEFASVLLSIDIPVSPTAAGILEDGDVTANFLADTAKRASVNLTAVHKTGAESSTVTVSGTIAYIGDASAYTIPSQDIVFDTTGVGPTKLKGDLTYIYFDPEISSEFLQTSTTKSDATEISGKRIFVGIGSAAYVERAFFVFTNDQPVFSAPFIFASKLEALVARMGTLIAGSASFKIGDSVSGTAPNENDGIFINDYNYWYDTGSFGIGDANRKVVWDGSALSINIDGNITVDDNGIRILSQSGNVDKIRWVNGVGSSIAEIYTGGGPALTIAASGLSIGLLGSNVKINKGVALFADISTPSTEAAGQSFFTTMYSLGGDFYKRGGTGTAYKILDASDFPITGNNGDTLYYNSGWKKLAKGLDGEVLTLASGLPTWAAAGGGVSYQPLDSDLTAIAALTPTTGQIIFAQSGSWTSLPIGTAGTFLKSSFGTPSWTNIVESDISNLGNTILLNSDIGSTVQGYSANLTSLASDPITASTAASTYQPLDDALSDIAGISTSQGDLLYGLATNSGWAKLPLGSAGTFLKSSFGTPSWTGIVEADISDLGTTIVLDSDIGSTVQAYSANLTSLASDPLTATTAAATYQPLDADLTDIAALTKGNGQLLTTTTADGYVFLPAGSNGQFLKMSFGTPSWHDTTDITALGIITAGTWSANPISDSYISSAATWNAKLGSGDIGVSVQAYDDALSDIAGINTSQGDLLYGLATNSGWTSLPLGASGTFLKSSLGTPSWSSIEESDISNLGTSIVLDTDIGSTVQGYSANLTSLAADPLTATTAASTYQPLDSNLTQISAISPSNGGLITFAGGSYSQLPAGTNGYFLKMSFGTPSWHPSTDITQVGIISSGTWRGTAIEDTYIGSHTHAASDITSGTFANARISESSVTQHEGALSITESQISDLGSYITNQKGVANLYSRYGQITVNSTTAVDFLGNSGSYVGTSTVPANSVLQGSIFRIVARGTRQGNSSDSHTYTLKIGSTTLLTYTYTPTNTFGGYDGWKFEAIVSVNATGSSGTVWAQGQFHNANNIYMFENTATDSYNTTSATDISLEVSTNTNTTATCEVAYIDVSRSSSVV